MTDRSFLPSFNVFSRTFHESGHRIIVLIYENYARQCNNDCCTSLKACHMRTCSPLPQHAWFLCCFFFVYLLMCTWPVENDETLVMRKMMNTNRCLSNFQSKETQNWQFFVFCSIFNANFSPRYFAPCSAFIEHWTVLRMFKMELHDTLH